VTLREINGVCVVDRTTRRKHDPRVASVEGEQIGDLLAEPIDNVTFFTTRELKRDARLRGDGA